MPKARFLDSLKPIQGLLPEVEAPNHKVSFLERIRWSLICLFIFLILSQIPLFGVVQLSKTDPFYWTREVLASSRGTMMELGVSPILTASMLMQLLIGFKVINGDMSLKEDRALISTAQKLFGLLICLGEAVVYVASGAYGPVGFLSGFLIILQLFVAGGVVQMLDEIILKSHGLGSGISLFMAANICGNIGWKALSLATINTTRGAEFEGALITLFHLLVARPNKFAALRDALYRSDAPNCSSLLATALIFVIVIYLQNFRVELPITYQKAMGKAMPGGHFYPIKLFYTSNVPVVLYSILVSNLYFISKMLCSYFGPKIIVNLVGQWQETDARGSIPVGGMMFFVSPPQTLSELVRNPIRTIAYGSFVLTSCAMFSKIWIECSSGTSAKDLAKQCKDLGIVIQHRRDESVVQVLNKIIPIAAAFGGICIGAVILAADFLGVIGSGAGILLAVTIIYQFLELFAREQHQLGQKQPSI